MTLTNLIRKQIGLMPFGYSFYKARGLYFLTFNGYKAGIAEPSIRQLKVQAWLQYEARTGDTKSRKQPASNLASNQAVTKRLPAIKHV
jgi:hypothetical protein